MSPRVPFRVAIWRGRELTMNVDATSAEMAEEIATYVVEYFGSRYLESTPEETVFCKAIPEER